MPQWSEFNRFANNYRSVHDENLAATGYSSFYFAERKIREIRNFVKQQSASLRILDLGCGDGLCARLFRNYFPNSDIQGLDVSRGIISKAQEKKSSKTSFGIFDGTRIPFLSEAFDVIMLANVLHHVDTAEKQVAILRECHRVLKIDGTLFVYEHNPINPITRKLVKDCPFDRNARLIRHTRLKLLLHKLDFNVKCRFIIFFPGSLARLDFLEKFLWWAPVSGQYCAICTKAPCKCHNYCQS